MSKLIVEMEMPRNCAECPFVTPYSRCVFLGGYAIDENKRADCCPIKGVLPDEHGDLIDRDEVKNEILKRMPSWCATSDQFCSRRMMLYPISRVKAVIAAERKDDGK